MRRKYIYILVVLLTITLVISQYVVEKKMAETTVATPEDPIYIDNDELVFIDSEQLSLKIINNQNDDNTIEYTYSIKIDGASGAHKYLYNDKEKYIVFSANGEAQITLKSNESITIFDLPVDSNYYVEQLTNVSDKYTTKTDNESKSYQSGLLTENKSIEFDNYTVIPKEETKEPEKIEQKNPSTLDNIHILFGILLCSIILLLGFKNIKIKRYE